jgi:hypothetical protein
MISRVFHYQPAFEDKGPSERSDAFVLNAVTDDSETLSMVSAHDGGVKKVNGNLQIQFLESDRLSIMYGVSRNYMHISQYWIVGAVVIAITFFAWFRLRSRLSDPARKHKAQVQE